MFFLCGFGFASVLTNHYGIPGTVDRGGRGTHTHTHTQGRGLYIIYEKYVRRVDLSRGACCASGAPERRILYFFFFFCVTEIEFLRPSHVSSTIRLGRRRSIRTNQPLPPPFPPPYPTVAHVCDYYLYNFLYTILTPTSARAFGSRKKKKITTAPNKNDRMEIIWLPSHGRGKKHEKNHNHVEQV